MGEPRYCELCGALTPEAQVVSGKFYCPKCVGRLQYGGSGMKDVVDAPLTDSVPGTPPEKIKFRCLGCGALLSVAPVSKKSSLTCPQCKTQMYIEPGGVVTPAHPAPAAGKLPGSGRHKAAIQPPSTPQEVPFGKEELDKMLDMGAGRGEETDYAPKTGGEMGETGAASQAPREERKEAQAPRLKVQRPSKLDQYRKIASGLPSAKENKVLIVIAAVLLLLPAVFALIVNTESGESVKSQLSNPTKTLREGIERLTRLTGKKEKEEPPEEQKRPEEKKEEEKKKQTTPPAEEKKTGS
ncbi:MAG: hypothetical protein N2234_01120 [Planctomycetota bacterium]|nr:hypothetical protein [Planctomycetota bacterium]